VFGFPSGFGYIDLENTSSPAIGGKAGLPAWLVSAVAGSALPAAPPPQAPAVAPSPTPTPDPGTPSDANPLVFNLTPLSPH
jgi:hypothetical protein